MKVTKDLIRNFNLKCKKCDQIKNHRGGGQVYCSMIDDVTHRKDTACLKFEGIQFIDRHKGINREERRK